MRIHQIKALIFDGQAMSSPHFLGKNHPIQLPQGLFLVLHRRDVRGHPNSCRGNAAASLLGHLVHQGPWSMPWNAMDASGELDDVPVKTTRVTEIMRILLLQLFLNLIFSAH